MEKELVVAPYANDPLEYVAITILNADKFPQDMILLNKDEARKVITALQTWITETQE